MVCNSIKDVENFLIKNRSKHVNTAKSILRIQEDAEDVVQEASIKVIRNFDKYNNTMPFEHWFHVMLVNLCKTAKGKLDKRHRSSVPLETALNVEDASLEAVENIIEAERSQSLAKSALKKYLKYLKPLHAQILWDVCTEEIAKPKLMEKYNMNDNIFRHHLIIARRELKSVMECYEKSHNKSVCSDSTRRTI